MEYYAFNFVLIFVSLLMAVNSQDARGSSHTHYPHDEI